MNPSVPGATEGASPTIPGTEGQLGAAQPYSITGLATQETVSATPGIPESVGQPGPATPAAEPQSIAPIPSSTEAPIYKPGDLPPPIVIDGKPYSPGQSQPTPEAAFVPPPVSNTEPAAASPDSLDPGNAPLTFGTNNEPMSGTDASTPTQSPAKASSPMAGNLGPDVSKQAITEISSNTTGLGTEPQKPEAPSGDPNLDALFQDVEPEARLSIIQAVRIAQYAMKASGDDPKMSQAAADAFGRKVASVMKVPESPVEEKKTA